MSLSNKKDINKWIGNKIRLRRKLLGINEKRLAEEAELSSNRLKQYEEGKSAIPASTLNKIARILSVPLGYFFED